MKPFPVSRDLTHREQIVLAQVVEGASSTEAGCNLNISPRTVEFHCKNTMRKLGARNVMELVGIVLGSDRTEQLGMSTSPISGEEVRSA
ncbi:MAG: helix-turn-helix transcriptional regulator [Anaerolineales bacterium]|nr:helix-turn-helix transcriptional regulator [Anaerolineales bacterium]